jgi:hypothetical protein
MVLFLVGPHLGLELHEELDPFVGADVRMSFSRSPLLLNPTFDYFFDEDRTLFQLGLHALGSLPLRSRLVDPYVGAGISVTGFSYDEGVPVPDDNGSRVGLNLVGGVCFEVPVLAPFAQTRISMGDIDLITISSGFLFKFGRKP